jgi:hypothetical protein
VAWTSATNLARGNMTIGDSRPPPLKGEKLHLLTMTMTNASV